MDDLARFLAMARGRKFGWGTWDCILWLGAYVAARHGTDPSLPWHGHYRTRLGAMRLVNRAQGMESLLDGALTPMGIRRASEPRRGDIAVVRASEGEMGAIVLGNGWVAQNGMGGVVRRLGVPVIAAWAI